MRVPYIKKSIQIVPWQIILLSVVFTGSLCLTLTLLYIIMPAKTPARIDSPRAIIVPKAAIQKIEEVPIFSPPARLVIKNIGIDTPIAPAGLTSDGLMDIKENPDEVAWYRFGPSPGEEGSAVIAGHYGWKDGHGSVFNNLHTLKPGDKIEVYNQNGVAVAFVVRETRKYDPKADAADVFISSDGRSHLNLVTCYGSWDGAVQSYSERLVVFADWVKINN